MKNSEDFTFAVSDAIEVYNYDAFVNEWETIKNKITNEEKRELIEYLLDNVYTDEKFPFFKAVFDEIIDKKFNLDYPTPHWAPNLLSFSLLKYSPRLFDYFIEKQASINFVTDSYADETDEMIKQEVEEEGRNRYNTCLDLAYEIRDSHIPETLEHFDFVLIEKEEDKTATVTIPKIEYDNLTRKVAMLEKLITTNQLIEKIKLLGGKTAKELN